MKLCNATIRPGTVVEVLDNGIIKAAAPGLFSITDDPTMLPPIMPWFIGHNSNAFSKLLENDEVWILNFTDNPRQLYWFRKDTLVDNTELKIPNTENRIIDEENVEIVCNRDANGEWATIYFSDGSGWVVGKGDSIIQIRKDGTILLSTGMANRCIDINGKSISIGSPGRSAHTAAYGDATEAALMKLCTMLSGVAMKAMANPYTMAIGTEMLAKLPGVTSIIPDISSEHVTID
jgi:hypothetical protein